MEVSVVTYPGNDGFFICPNYCKNSNGASTRRNLFQLWEEQWRMTENYLLVG
jgi:hypothetical protein